MTAIKRAFVGFVLAAVFAALFPVSLHAQAGALQVALVTADSSGAALDVEAQLENQGLVVTVINVGPGAVRTPTTDELLMYQAVLTWSFIGRNYADPSGLGDALAGYVDAGRGVVQAVGAFAPNAPARLDGRWRAGAYEPFTFSPPFSDGMLELGAVQPLHPIMRDVASFNGGTFSFHHAVEPQGCAELVAQWSNGRGLVAARVGPRGGRVVGLNFYPPSNAAVANGWDRATDGGLLMANALRFAATPAASPSGEGPAIVLAAADELAWIEDVRCKLQDTQLFSRVDVIDASMTTPSVASLLAYDAVLTWSNNRYRDSAALGNVLADYVDADRGVVQAVNSFVPWNGIGGRWGASGYRPFTEGNEIAFTPGVLVPVLSDHRILSGVAAVSGGEASYHSFVGLGAATTVVANWSDAQPLVAVGAGPAAGRVVGLNFFPPSSDVGSGLWESATDGARLIANTLLFAANRAPIADAGGDRSVEATSPAGASFTLNATGTDSDGDPLTFTWSGAVSAVGPTVTIDVPPPAAPSTSQTHTVILTVSDGRGGETTDSLELTVTDTTAPALNGVPSGVVTAPATGPTGATVTYGPVTAVDAVDGDRPVECLPAASGIFPIGDTVVTCSSSDSRGNATVSTFTVSVTAEEDEATPGGVFGYGYIRDDDMNYVFAFDARKTRSGSEYARLSMTVRSGYCGRHRHGHRRNDQFVSKTVDSVAFTDDSEVLFAGTGRWNGKDGYRYEVAADDRFIERRSYDIVHITIKSPTGAVVAQVDGRLTGGWVRFVKGR